MSDQQIATETRAGLMGPGHVGRLTASALADLTNISEAVFAAKAIAAGASQVVVQAGGSAVATRRTLNFIAGPGLTMAVADNAASGRVDIAIQTMVGSGATLDPANKGAALALSDGNLTVTASGGVGGVRVTAGKTGGKYYWETYGGYRSETGVGLVASTASLTGSADPRSLLGATYLWGHLDGSKRIQHNGTSYSLSCDAIWGDKTIGIAADLDARKWWFRINEIWQMSGNPITGENPLPYFPSGPAFHPLCVVYPAGLPADQGYALTARLAFDTWNYPAPSGYGQWM